MYELAFAAVGVGEQPAALAAAPFGEHTESGRRGWWLIARPLALTHTSLEEQAVGQLAIGQPAVGQLAVGHMKLAVGQLAMPLT